MYNTVSTQLINAGAGDLETLVDEVGSMFVAILPVALPVLGGIAIGFFAIKVVRALLHI